jgi:integrase
MPRKKGPPQRWELSDRFCRTADETTWDTLQQGLCLKVYDSGTKVFKAAYRHEGRLRWFNIGQYGSVGVKEAREIAREIRAKATLGQDPQGEKVAARKAARVGVTLAQLYESHLKGAKARNKSWRQADYLMRTHVLPKLGKRKIEVITQDDMIDLRDKLSNRKALCNAVLAAASATFRWAVEKKHITTNPCHGVSRHKLNSRERFLSDREIRKVWPLFDELGLYQATILKLILWTAQRPGEVSAMRWEHLDLEDGWWSMPGEPTEGWPGTKNCKNHQVPLSPPVLELLRDLEPKPSGPVFPAPRGRGGIPIPSTISIWEAAGMEPFRPHDLRATAATGMYELDDIAPHHISAVLNHYLAKGESKTTAIYIRHIKRKHRKMALEAWTNKLLAILNPRRRL